MKLRIISDGTPEGTRVEDEQGNVLENVKEVGWFADERSGILARIVVERVETDVVSSKSEINKE